MATVRKTITVTDQQDSWIKAQIETLRKSLIEGENSGEPPPFDAAAFKQRMLQMVSTT